MENPETARHLQRTGAVECVDKTEALTEAIECVDETEAWVPRLVQEPLAEEPDTAQVQPETVDVAEEPESAPPQPDQEPVERADETEAWVPNLVPDPELAEEPSTAQVQAEQEPVERADETEAWVPNLVPDPAPAEEPSTAQVQADQEPVDTSDETEAWRPAARQAAPQEAPSPPAPPPATPERPRNPYAIAIPQEVYDLAESIATGKPRQVVADPDEEYVRATNLVVDLPPLVTTWVDTRKQKQELPPWQARWQERLARFRHATWGANTALEMSVAFRELSLMMSAGLNISSALGLLARTLDNPRLQEGFSKTMDAVLNGRELSAGLACSPEVFPNVLVQLVKVGEKSGHLDTILDRIADFQEKQARLRMKMRSTLTYPVFMFAVSLVILVLLPGLLFENIFQMLRELNADVPVPTRLLMGFSLAIRNPMTYVVLAGVGAAIIAAYRHLMRQHDMRLVRDEFLFNTWGLGPCLRYMASVSFAQTLETMYSAGLPILTALECAGKATGNAVVERAAERVRDGIREGMTLPEALAAADFLPRSFARMVEAGDQAGKTSDMLDFAARIAQEEVEHRIATAVAALEPAMLLGMGIMVGSLVLAVISPLLKVLETLTM